ncbi:hypothetical protein PA598K_00495 [Paenibacillus sp. 598K]|uniref:YbjN domain-containing protein n=1 Tax=Paenibacillus sp. 598K TaxID=1117987 RepID=UPI000FFA526C|nr:YbjN domain-containing protein [Paenibacillus sp. 598K]GBF72257.1 hypothetical protein PA598K_00495 [Paenibacillus sp. 598K]
MPAREDANAIRTRYPLSFLSLEGEALPVELTRLVWEAADHRTAVRCEITFEAEGHLVEAWIADERFHLFTDLVNAEPSFDLDEPVVIRARLRQSYARRIASSGGDSQTILAALLPGATEHTFLRQSECWLALELMQQIPLPDALASEGVVRHGLQTAWLQSEKAAAQPEDHTGHRKPDDARDETSGVASYSGAQTMLLERLLQQLNLRYEVFASDVVRLDIRTEIGSWRMLIHISESDWCSVYSVFPELVPTSAHAAVAVQLMNLNYDGPGGAFELDAEDGELRFRTSIPGAGSLSAGTLAAVLAEHRRIMERYLPQAGDWSKLS